MEKKYKTEPEGNMLRIIALKDFSDIKKGDRGGLIEKEKNLSQMGDCWVYRKARVWGNAEVYHHAQISGNAKVYGNARVYGSANVYENAEIFGNAEVYGEAGVFEDAWVYGNAEVFENAQVHDNARVGGNAKVFENVKIWSTRISDITTSIENNKDYIMFGDKDGKGFRIFSSNMKVKDDDNNIIAITAINYLKNIQTIRQIYGEEV